MVRKEGATYPNGLTKSRLLEIYLSCRDFGCTPEDFQFDLDMVRRSERQGQAECVWVGRNDGRIFVSDLSLADASKVVEIVEDGFRVVPANHRVFVSYAKEDTESARRLCEHLRGAGASPWLDEDMLLPGQRREIEIEAEIAQSDYFLALLSSRSVAKRGYVQREIRQALDVLDRVPDKDIYLLPVRLDECDPAHNKIRGLHWVDLFPDWNAGLKRILRSLGLNNWGQNRILKTSEGGRL